ncbi:hypothetical protein [Pyrobaculum neutrophilum]|uniref:Glycosyl transferase family 2 n=1 Tax=Pyrobaculum neutrophilum (strain DSM 2338 / JCM 9278 / NBRC 100436 / V24Sta) TaxID=444157 RepID=B1YCT6_PYRNV|nr:hypothetical protein [Pyrobaculum neutrophilum]ACB39599.1 conserved hypothetical protein [Pyrobaculum neutrophilum V24Sta]
MLPLIAAIAIYDFIHLLTEIRIRPGRLAPCRSVVVMATRGVKGWGRYRDFVDYVVVDDRRTAEEAEAAGLRALLNKYGGKSGALATALEELEAELYIFVDDDAVPGPWLDLLRRSCGRFATAYRWVLDRFQNAFSLGGFDWMVWKKTRFMYGGAMAIPGHRRREVAEALKVCPVDDMAVTAVAEDIEVLPYLVPMEPADGAWEFFIRQATAAKIGNAALWAMELVYYGLWTAAAVLFPPLFLLQAARTALRSRRALGRVDWVQVLLSPIERPLQFAVFLATIPRRCFRWRGRIVCGCSRQSRLPS